MYFCFRAIRALMASQSTFENRMMNSSFYFLTDFYLILHKFDVTCDIFGIVLLCSYGCNCICKTIICFRDHMNHMNHMENAWNKKVEFCNYELNKNLHWNGWRKWVVSILYYISHIRSSCSLSTCKNNILCISVNVHHAPLQTMYYMSTEPAIWCWTKCNARCILMVVGR